MLFSIVIPTYKRPDLLLNCLSHLEKQKYSKTFQVIVINDDVSIDLNNTIVRDYEFDIVVINNSVNLGPGGCRNIGAKKAVGEWLVFLDDDDEFSLNKLQVLSNNIKNDISVIINRASIKLIDEKIQYNTGRIDANNYQKNIYKNNTMGGAPLLSIRKKDFILLSGYDENLSALEDYEFNIRIVKSKLKTLFLDDILTTCNYSSNVMSVSKSIKYNLEALESIILKHSYDFSKPSIVKSWLYSSLAFKALLMNDRKASLLYLQSFWYKKSIKVFSLFIISIFSKQTIFLIRSKLK
jgi:glycosyltransferase involved in cell wall biosynthesis